MNKCGYVDENKQSCKAFHTKQSKYCFRHDPVNKETALLASQKGGENRKLQAQFGEDVFIQTSSDVIKFLSVVINKVWSGQIPIQVGNSMGFLTRCWLEAYEVTSLEKRMSDIEDTLCET